MLAGYSRRHEKESSVNRAVLQPIRCELAHNSVCETVGAAFLEAACAFRTGSGEKPG